MAKVLVTGATGFIGSRIVRQLCEAGEHVKVLVRPGSSTAALGRLPVEVVTGDILLGDTVFRALVGCDRLYHVAAVYRQWDRDPLNILRPALEGTREVLEAVRRRDGAITKVVVTSSVAAIGAVRLTEGLPEPLDESARWTLEDSETYVVAKRRAEELALSLADTLPIVVVNPTAVFGPGDHRPTPTGGGLLQFLNWPWPLPFPGGPGGFSVVDVDDVARGHLLAMAKGRIGERYILGGENLTVSQVFETAASIAGLPKPGRPPGRTAAMWLGRLLEWRARIDGVDPPLTYRLARDFYDGFFWVSSRKATEELGYRHRPARLTLARAIRWFLDRGYIAPGIAQRIRTDELPEPEREPTLVRGRGSTIEGS